MLDHHPAHIVFGPRNRANMYNLIDRIARGRYINIGNGSNIKSVAYVENLVEASLFLVNKLSHDVHIYNYADSPHLTTREITRIIFDGLGQKPPRLKIPLSLALLMEGRSSIFWFTQLQFSCLMKEYGAFIRIMSQYQDIEEVRACTWM